MYRVAWGAPGCGGIRVEIMPIRQAVLRSITIMRVTTPATTVKLLLLNGQHLSRGQMDATAAALRDNEQA